MINSDLIKFPPDNYVVLFTFENKNRILNTIESALKTLWPNYLVEFDTRDFANWTPEIVSSEVLHEFVNCHTHSIVTFFRDHSALKTYRAAEDYANETEQTFIEIHFRQRKNLFLMAEKVKEVPVDTFPKFSKEPYEAFFCSSAVLSITLGAPSNESSTQLTRGMIQTILSSIVS